MQSKKLVIFVGVITFGLACMLTLFLGCDTTPEEEVNAPVTTAHSTVPAVAGPAPGLTLNEEKTQLIFVPEMTQQELDNIQKQLADEGHELTYDEVQFAADGSLQSVKFRIRTNDGFAGGMMDDNVALRRNVGFVRNYKEGKDAFRTGIIR